MGWPLVVGSFEFPHVKAYPATIGSGGATPDKAGAIFMSDERRERQVQRAREQLHVPPLAGWRKVLDYTAAGSTFGLLIMAAAVLIGTNDYSLAIGCFVGATIAAIVWWIDSPSICNWEIDADRPLGLIGAFVILAMGLLVAYWTYDKQVDFELHQLHGVLVPADDPMPQNACGTIPSNAVVVFLGDVASVVQSFPHTVLSVHRQSVLTLERTDDGGIAVVVDIRSSDGKIVARLNRDGFLVNEHNSLEMKRIDKSSLVVEDEYGKEVLNARHLNKHAFRLTGILQYPGMNPIHIPFAPHFSACSSNAGSSDININ